MKMKHLPFVVLGFFLLELFSCAPVYVPNVLNTPMLSKAGEVQLTVHNATSGFDPQFAVAITDNIGIMLNGSFSDVSFEDSDDYRKHKFFEMGVGYYQKITENFQFETFGGYGFGKIQSNFSNHFWAPKGTINLNRFFIQPTVGASFHPFEGCISARAAHVSFANKNRSSQGIFFEPAITGKLVYKRMKGIVQFGFSLPVVDYDLAFEYQPVILSIGLSLSLGKMDD